MRALPAFAFLAALAILCGCEGPAGPIGPQGPKGDTGTPGQDGQDGLDGSGVVRVHLVDNYLETPVPGDNVSVAVPGWIPLQSGEHVIIQGFASTLDGFGNAGLIELPFLVNRGVDVAQAAVSWTADGNGNADVALTYLDGFYVVVLVTVVQTDNWFGA